MDVIVSLRCKKHNRGTQPLPFRLQQHARDADNRRAFRELTVERGEVVAGPWSYTQRPFELGLYCVHCLNEGERTPLSVDEEDLADLGLADSPVVFTQPSGFEPGEVIAGVKDAFPSRLRYIKTLPPTVPDLVPDAVLDRLQVGLSSAIRARILKNSRCLYRFQHDAISAALDGNDVIVTTPTASGKSLTYLAPMLDALLADPTATALYLSPLVALAGDQFDAISQFDSENTDWASKGERFSIHRSLRTIQFGKQQTTIARYDGTVPQGDREAIRKRKPQLLMLTPDMLHLGILTRAFEESSWAYLFRGLRYVIIDEMHIYRGVLGGAFSNLMRRLMRICAQQGSEPRFLAASATVVKPADSMARLTGRHPVVIDGGNCGAPQRERQLIVWSGQVDDGARAISTEAKDALLFLMKSKTRTIAFGRSISEINDIYRFLTAELREVDLKQIHVSPYYRELPQEEKRRIVRDLRAGRLHCVISTSALEMGIDIGQLSSAVIIGFPGSVAQLWQQAGRAGRAGKGLIILVLDKDPLDQFFVAHPDVLFDLQAEPMYCNPDNPYIVRDHLVCAARELPLSEHEIGQFGPSALEVLRRLVEESILKTDETTCAYTLGESADAFLKNSSFRNVGFSVDVITEDDRQLVVQVDAARAQRALHKYARYQHIDKYYEVTRYDVDHRTQRGQILVREVERAEYITSAPINRSVAKITVHKSRPIAGATAEFATIASTASVEGYYRIPLYARSDPFQYQPLGLAAPDDISYRTQGIWLTLHSISEVCANVDELGAGLYSLAGAIRLATAIEELCDPSDIEAIPLLQDSGEDISSIVVFDTVPGGIGISDAAFDKLDGILRRAYSILAECPFCSQHPESPGCPYCVTARFGDETTINRTLAIDIARHSFNIRHG